MPGAVAAWVRGWCPRAEGGVVRDGAGGGRTKAAAGLLLGQLLGP